MSSIAMVLPALLARMPRGVGKPTWTVGPVFGTFRSLFCQHFHPTLADGRSAIEIRAAVPPWHHVRPMGEDMVATELVLPANHKLRPVDFTTDVVFMAGMAHYPKLLDETMIQAQAAASRAARALSQETLTAGGRVAVVDQSLCTGCLTCVRVCPWEIPKIDEGGYASIKVEDCRACGICVAECPAQAISVHHYLDEQIEAKVQGLFE